MNTKSTGIKESFLSTITRQFQKSAEKERYLNVAELNEVKYSPDNEAFFKPPMPKSPPLQRNFEIICNDGTRVKIDPDTICKFEF